MLISVFHRRKLRTLVQIVSLAVTLSFVFPFITWAFEAAQYPVGLKPLELTYQGLSVSLPEKFCKVNRTFQGKQKLIVHIEDLHCNAEVQQHIAEMIGYLADKHQLQLAGLEGAFQTITTAKLSTFPMPEVRQEVCDYFLKNGKLSGAEYYSATHAQPVRLEGIDDPGLYAASRKLVDSFFNAESQGYCQDLKEALDALKPQFYNPRLLAWESQAAAFRQGNLDLLGYALAISRSAGENHLGLGAYPQLQQLASQGKSLLAAEVDSEVLQSELTAADAAIRENLYTDPIQRQLDDLYGRLTLLEKMLNISATPAELYKFRQERARFTARVFADFIRSRQADADLGSEADWQHLDGYVAAAEKFYQLAEKRSTAFVSRLIAKMERFHAPMAVMITGGFHTPEILAELEKQNISYISVKPRWTRQDTVNPYFELLQNKRTPLEKLLAKNQNILALRTSSPDGPWSSSRQVVPHQQLTQDEGVFDREEQMLLENTALKKLGRQGLSVRQIFQKMSEAVHAYLGYEQGAGLDLSPASLAENLRLERQAGTKLPLLVVPTTLQDETGALVKTVIVWDTRLSRAAERLPAIQKIEMNGTQYLFYGQGKAETVVAQMLSQRTAWTTRLLAAWEKARAAVGQGWQAALAGFQRKIAEDGMASIVEGELRRIDAKFSETHPEEYRAITLEIVPRLEMYLFIPGQEEKAFTRLQSEVNALLEKKGISGRINMDWRAIKLPSWRQLLLSGKFASVAGFGLLVAYFSTHGLIMLLPMLTTMVFLMRRADVFRAAHIGREASKPLWWTGLLFALLYFSPLLLASTGIGLGLVLLAQVSAPVAGQLIVLAIGYFLLGMVASTDPFLSLNAKGTMALHSRYNAWMLKLGLLPASTLEESRLEELKQQALAEVAEIEADAAIQERFVAMLNQYSPGTQTKRIFDDKIDQPAEAWTTSEIANLFNNKMLELSSFEDMPPDLENDQDVADYKAAIVTLGVLKARFGARFLRAAILRGQENLLPIFIRYFYAECGGNFGRILSMLAESFNLPEDAAFQPVLAALSATLVGRTHNLTEEEFIKIFNSATPVPGHSLLERLVARTKLIKVFETLDLVELSAPRYMAEPVAPERDPEYSELKNRFVRCIENMDKSIPPAYALYLELIKHGFQNVSIVDAGHQHFMVVCDNWAIDPAPGDYPGKVAKTGLKPRGLVSELGWLQVFIGRLDREENYPYLQFEGILDKEEIERHIAAFRFRSGGKSPASVADNALRQIETQLADQDRYNFQVLYRYITTQIVPGLELGLFLPGWEPMVFAALNREINALLQKYKLPDQIALRGHIDWSNITLPAWKKSFIYRLLSLGVLAGLLIALHASTLGLIVISMAPVMLFTLRRVDVFVAAHGDREDQRKLWWAGLMFAVILFAPAILANAVAGAELAHVILYGFSTKWMVSGFFLLLGDVFLLLPAARRSIKVHAWFNRLMLRLGLRPASVVEWAPLQSDPELPSHLQEILTAQKLELDLNTFLPYARKQLLLRHQLNIALGDILNSLREMSDYTNENQAPSLLLLARPDGSQAYYNLLAPELARAVAPMQGKQTPAVRQAILVRQVLAIDQLVFNRQIPSRLSAVLSETAGQIIQRDEIQVKVPKEPVLEMFLYFMLSESRVPTQTWLDMCADMGDGLEAPMAVRLGKVVLTRLAQNTLDTLGQLSAGKILNDRHVTELRKLVRLYSLGVSSSPKKNGWVLRKMLLCLPAWREEYRLIAEDLPRMVYPKEILPAWQASRRRQQAQAQQIAEQIHQGVSPWWAHIAANRQDAEHPYLVGTYQGPDGKLRPLFGSKYYLSLRQIEDVLAPGDIFSPEMQVHLLECRFTPVQPLLERLSLNQGGNIQRDGVPAQIFIPNEISRLLPKELLEHFARNEILETGLSNESVLGKVRTLLGVGGGVFAPSADMDLYHMSDADLNALAQSTDLDAELKWIQAKLKAASEGTGGKYYLLFTGNIQNTNEGRLGTLVYLEHGEIKPVAIQVDHKELEVGIKGCGTEIGGFGNLHKRHGSDKPAITGGMHASEAVAEAARLNALGETSAARLAGVLLFISSQGHGPQGQIIRLMPGSVRGASALGGVYPDVADAETHWEVARQMLVNFVEMLYAEHPAIMDNSFHTGNLMLFGNGRSELVDFSDHLDLADSSLPRLGRENDWLSLRSLLWQAMAAREQIPGYQESTDLARWNAELNRLFREHGMNVQLAATDTTDQMVEKIWNHAMAYQVFRARQESGYIASGVLASLSQEADEDRFFALLDEYLYDEQSLLDSAQTAAPNSMTVKEPKKELESLSFLVNFMHEEPDLLELVMVHESRIRQLLTLAAYQSQAPPSQATTAFGKVERLPDLYTQMERVGHGREQDILEEIQGMAAIMPKLARQPRCPDEAGPKCASVLTADLPDQEKWAGLRSAAYRLLVDLFNSSRLTLTMASAKAEDQTTLITVRTRGELYRVIRSLLGHNGKEQGRTAIEWEKFLEEDKKGFPSLVAWRQRNPQAEFTEAEARKELGSLMYDEPGKLRGLWEAVARVFREESPAKRAPASVADAELLRLDKKFAQKYPEVYHQITTEIAPRLELGLFFPGQEEKAFAAINQEVNQLLVDAGIIPNVSQGIHLEWDAKLLPSWRRFLAADRLAPLAVILLLTVYFSTRGLFALPVDEIIHHALIALAAIAPLVVMVGYTLRRADVFAAAHAGREDTRRLWWAGWAFSLVLFTPILLASLMLGIGIIWLFSASAAKMLLVAILLSLGLNFGSRISYSLQQLSIDAHRIFNQRSLRLGLKPASVAEGNSGSVDYYEMIGQVMNSRDPQVFSQALRNFQAEARQRSDEHEAIRVLASLATAAGLNPIYRVPATLVIQGQERQVNLYSKIYYEWLQQLGYRTPELESCFLIGEAIQDPGKWAYLLFAPGASYQAARDIARDIASDMMIVIHPLLLDAFEYCAKETEDPERAKINLLAEIYGNVDLKSPEDFKKLFSQCLQSMMSGKLHGHQGQAILASIIFIALSQGHMETEEVHQAYLQIMKTNRPNLIPSWFSVLREEPLIWQTACAAAHRLGTVTPSEISDMRDFGAVLIATGELDARLAASLAREIGYRRPETIRSITPSLPDAAGGSRLLESIPLADELSQIPAVKNKSKPPKGQALRNFNLSAIVRPKVSTLHMVPGYNLPVGYEVGYGAIGMENKIQRDQSVFTQEVPWQPHNRLPYQMEFNREQSNYGAHDLWVDEDQISFFLTLAAFNVSARCIIDRHALTAKWNPVSTDQYDASGPEQTTEVRYDATRRRWEVGIPGSDLHLWITEIPGQHMPVQKIAYHMTNIADRDVNIPLQIGFVAQPDHKCTVLVADSRSGKIIGFGWLDTQTRNIEWYDPVSSGTPEPYLLGTSQVEVFPDHYSFTIMYNRMEPLARITIAGAEPGKIKSKVKFETLSAQLMHAINSFQGTNVTEERLLKVLSRRSGPGYIFSHNRQDFALQPVSLSEAAKAGVGVLAISAGKSLVLFANQQTGDIYYLGIADPSFKRIIWYADDKMSRHLQSITRMDFRDYRVTFWLPDGDILLASGTPLKLENPIIRKKTQGKSALLKRWTLGLFSRWLSEATYDKYLVLFETAWSLAFAASAVLGLLVDANLLHVTISWLPVDTVTDALATTLKLALVAFPILHLDALLAPLAPRERGEGRGEGNPTAMVGAGLKPAPTNVNNNSVGANLVFAPGRSQGSPLQEPAEMAPAVTPWANVAAAAFISIVTGLLWLALPAATGVLLLLQLAIVASFFYVFHGTFNEFSNRLARAGLTLSEFFKYIMVGNFGELLAKTRDQKLAWFVIGLAYVLETMAVALVPAGIVAIVWLVPGTGAAMSLLKAFMLAGGVTWVWSMAGWLRYARHQVDPHGNPISEQDQKNIQRDFMVMGFGAMGVVLAFLLLTQGYSPEIILHNQSLLGINASLLAVLLAAIYHTGVGRYALAHGYADRMGTILNISPDEATMQPKVDVISQLAEMLEDQDLRLHFKQFRMNAALGLMKLDRSITAKDVDRALEQMTANQANASLATASLLRLHDIDGEPVYINLLAPLLRTGDGKPMPFHMHQALLVEQLLRIKDRVFDYLPDAFAGMLRFSAEVIRKGGPENPPDKNAEAFLEMFLYVLQQPDQAAARQWLELYHDKPMDMPLSEALQLGREGLDPTAQHLIAELANPHENLASELRQLERMAALGVPAAAQVNAAAYRIFAARQGKGYMPENTITSLAGATSIEAFAAGLRQYLQGEQELLAAAGRSGLDDGQLLPQARHELEERARLAEFLLADTVSLNLVLQQRPAIQRLLQFTCYAAPTEKALPESAGVFAQASDLRELKGQVREHFSGDMDEAIDIAERMDDMLMVLRDFSHTQPGNDLLQVCTEVLTASLPNEGPLAGLRAQTQHLLRIQIRSQEALASALLAEQSFANAHSIGELQVLVLGKIKLGGKVKRRNAAEWQDVIEEAYRALKQLQDKSKLSDAQAMSRLSDFGLVYADEWELSGLWEAILRIVREEGLEAGWQPEEGVVMRVLAQPTKLLSPLLVFSASNAHAAAHWNWKTVLLIVAGVWILAAVAAWLVTSRYPSMYSSIQNWVKLNTVLIRLRQNNPGFLKNLNREERQALLELSRHYDPQILSQALPMIDRSMLLEVAEDPNILLKLLKTRQLGIDIAVEDWKTFYALIRKNWPDPSTEEGSETYETMGLHSSVTAEEEIKELERDRLRAIFRTLLLHDHGDPLAQVDHICSTLPDTRRTSLGNLRLVFAQLVLKDLKSLGLDLFRAGIRTAMTWDELLGAANQIGMIRFCMLEAKKVRGLSAQEWIEKINRTKEVLNMSRADLTNPEEWKRTLPILRDLQGTVLAGLAETLAVISKLEQTTEHVREVPSWGGLLTKLEAGKSDMRLYSADDQLQSTQEYSANEVFLMIQRKSEELRDRGVTHTTPDIWRKELPAAFFQKRGTWMDDLDEIISRLHNESNEKIGGQTVFEWLANIQDAWNVLTAIRGRKIQDAVFSITLPDLHHGRLALSDAQLQDIHHKSALTESEIAKAMNKIRPGTGGTSQNIQHWVMLLWQADSGWETKVEQLLAVRAEHAAAAAIGTGPILAALKNKVIQWIGIDPAKYDRWLVWWLENILALLGAGLLVGLPVFLSMSSDVSFALRLLTAGVASYAAAWPLLALAHALDPRTPSRNFYLAALLGTINLLLLLTPFSLWIIVPLSFAVHALLVWVAPKIREFYLGKAPESIQPTWQNILREVLRFNFLAVYLSLRSAWQKELLVLIAANMESAVVVIPAGFLIGSGAVLLTAGSGMVVLAGAGLVAGGIAWAWLVAQELVQLRHKRVLLRQVIRQSTLPEQARLRLQLFAYSLIPVMLVWTVILAQSSQLDLQFLLSTHTVGLVLWTTAASTLFAGLAHYAHGRFGFYVLGLPLPMGGVVKTRQQAQAGEQKIAYYIQHFETAWNELTHEYEPSPFLSGIVFSLRSCRAAIIQAIEHGEVEEELDEIIEQRLNTLLINDHQYKMRIINTFLEWAQAALAEHLENEGLDPWEHLQDRIDALLPDVPGRVSSASLGEKIERVRAEIIEYAAQHGRQIPEVVWLAFVGQIPDDLPGLPWLQDAFSRMMREQLQNMPQAISGMRPSTGKWLAQIQAAGDIDSLRAVLGAFSYADPTAVVFGHTVAEWLDRVNAAWAEMLALQAIHMDRPLTAAEIKSMVRLVTRGGDKDSASELYGLREKLKQIAENQIFENQENLPLSSAWDRLYAAVRLVVPETEAGYTASEWAALIESDRQWFLRRLQAGQSADQVAAVIREICENLGESQGTGLDGLQQSVGLLLQQEAREFQASRLSLASTRSWQEYWETLDRLSQRSGQVDGRLGTDWKALAVSLRLRLLQIARENDGEVGDEDIQQVCEELTQAEGTLLQGLRTGFEHLITMELQAMQYTYSAMDLENMQNYPGYRWDEIKKAIAGQELKTFLTSWERIWNEVGEMLATEYIPRDQRADGLHWDQWEMILTGVRQWVVRAGQDNPDSVAQTKDRLLLAIPDQDAFFLSGLRPVISRLLDIELLTRRAFKDKTTLPEYSDVSSTGGIIESLKIKVIKWTGIDPQKYDRRIVWWLENDLALLSGSLVVGLPVFFLMSGDVSFAVRLLTAGLASYAAAWPLLVLAHALDPNTPRRNVYLAAGIAVVNLLLLLTPFSLGIIVILSMLVHAVVVWVAPKIRESFLATHEQRTGQAAAPGRQVQSLEKRYPANSTILQRNWLSDQVPLVRQTLMLFSGLAFYGVQLIARVFGSQPVLSNQDLQNLNQHPRIRAMLRAHFPEYASTVAMESPDSVQIQVLEPGIGLWNYILGLIWGHVAIHKNLQGVQQPIIYISMSVLNQLVGQQPIVMDENQAQQGLRTLLFGLAEWQMRLTVEEQADAYRFESRIQQGSMLAQAGNIALVLGVAVSALANHGAALGTILIWLGATVQGYRFAFRDEETNTGLRWQQLASGTLEVLAIVLPLAAWLSGQHMAAAHGMMFAMAGIARISAYDLNRGTDDFIPLSLPTRFENGKALLYYAWRKAGLNSHEVSQLLANHYQILDEITRGMLFDQAKLKLRQLLDIDAGLSDSGKFGGIQVEAPADYIPKAKKYWDAERNARESAKRLMQSRPVSQMSEQECALVIRQTYLNYDPEFILRLEDAGQDFVRVASGLFTQQSTWRSCSPERLVNMLAVDQVLAVALGVPGEVMGQLYSLGNLGNLRLWAEEHPEVIQQISMRLAWMNCLKSIRTEQERLNTPENFESVLRLARFLRATQEDSEAAGLHAALVRLYGLQTMQPGAAPELLGENIAVQAPYCELTPGLNSVRFWPGISRTRKHVYAVSSQEMETCLKLLAAQAGLGQNVSIVREDASRLILAPRSVGVLRLDNLGIYKNPWEFSEYWYGMVLEAVVPGGQLIVVTNARTDEDDPILQRLQQQAARGRWQVQTLYTNAADQVISAPTQEARYRAIVFQRPVIENEETMTRPIPVLTQLLVLALQDLGLPQLPIGKDHLRELRGILRERILLFEDGISEMADQLRDPASAEFQNLVNHLQTRKLLAPAAAANVYSNQILFMRDYIWPAIIARKDTSGSRNIRISSLGATTGEDLYRITMGLKIALKAAGGQWDVILAADDCSAENLQTLRAKLAGLDGTIKVTLETHPMAFGTQASQEALSQQDNDVVFWHLQEMRPEVQRRVARSVKATVVITDQALEFGAAQPHPEIFQGVYLDAHSNLEVAHLDEKQRQTQIETYMREQRAHALWKYWSRYALEMREGEIQTMLASVGQNLNVDLETSSRVVMVYMGIHARFPQEPRIPFGIYLSFFQDYNDINRFIVLASVLVQNAPKKPIEIWMALNAIKAGKETTRLVPTEARLGKEPGQVWTKVLPAPKKENLISEPHLFYKSLILVIAAIAGAALALVAPDQARALAWGLGVIGFYGVNASLQFLALALARASQFTEAEELVHRNPAVRAHGMLHKFLRENIRFADREFVVHALDAVVMPVAAVILVKEWLWKDQKQKRRAPRPRLQSPAQAA